jgi:hypothetical protein
MRWRRVVVKDRRPSTSQWEQAEYRLRNMLRRREMKGGLLNGDGVEPDHVAVIIGKLSMFVIVAAGMVGLEMPMNC